MIFGKKKRRSRQDLKAVVDKRKKGEELDFDEDEVTAVTDLVLERTKRASKACRDELDKAVDDIKTLRLPEKGPTEEAG
jgi:hypothetical protein